VTDPALTAFNHAGAHLHDAERSLAQAVLEERSEVVIEQRRDGVAERHLVITPTSVAVVLGPAPGAVTATLSLTGASLEALWDRRVGAANLLAQGAVAVSGDASTFARLQGLLASVAGRAAN